MSSSFGLNSAFEFGKLAGLRLDYNLTVMFWSCSSKQCVKKFTKHRPSNREVESCACLRCISMNLVRPNSIRFCFFVVIAFAFFSVFVHMLAYSRFKNRFNAKPLRFICYIIWMSIYVSLCEYYLLVVIAIMSYGDT